MKHNFVSAIAQGGDSTLVGPNEWNDFHVFGVTPTSADLTLNVASHEMVLCTGGAIGINITLPSAIGNTGRPFIVKKVDSGVGLITILTTLSQTIDGDSSYLLTNQWQFVKVVSDGANWIIWGLN